MPQQRLETDCTRQQKNGVVDFVPYLKAIASANFDGAISLELEYSPEPDKIVEWVTEAYQATDTLMKEAGITRG